MSFFRFKKEHFVPQRKMKKEELDKAVDEFNEESEEATIFFEASDLDAKEVEKSEEQRGAILFFADKIVGEMQSLGIDAPLLSGEEREELIERIHFLKSKETFRADIFNDKTKTIELYLSGDKLHDYASILHEMLHLFSATKIFIQEGKSPKIKVGYSIEEKMDSFNEAVTEKMTNEILLKSREELSNKFNLPLEEIDEYVAQSRTYEELRKSLSLIIESISRETGMDVGEFWNQIKRSYFTGKLFFLRKLQKAYGDRFLWFLIHLDELLKEGSLEEKDIPRIVSSKETFQEFIGKF